MKEYYGERMEEPFYFWSDPYDPRYIQLYGAPFFLRTSDERTVVEGWDANENRGHADIVEFQGQLYIVRDIFKNPSAQHEDEHGEGGYQKGVMHLWRDHNQKKRQRLPGSIINA